MYNFKNVQSIDPKTCIDFEFDVQRDNPIFKIKQNKLGDHNIWTIDNFLHQDECNSIIQKGEEIGFEFLEYRNLNRVLCFDRGESLIKVIQNRLEESDFLLTLNANGWTKPIGFNTNGINWKKNGKRINECLRITKYENLNQFDWHRDSPYTNSELSRSNYTMIIYLNDDFEGGETSFKVPTNKINHNGLTIDEEQKLMKDVIETTIKPKKGTLLIFPQCLMHKGNQVIGTKYILRSDLVCVGTPKQNYIKTKLENEINSLAKKLFRQAQIYELYGNPKCDELYERCISLRQCPHLITKYPEHLKKLIVAYKTEPKITLNMNSMLQFVERSGTRYEYSYRSLNNKFMMLKLATLFTITFELNKITHENVNTLFATLLDEMGICYDVKKLVKPNKTDYFRDYYSNYNCFTEETELISSGSELLQKCIDTFDMIKNNEHLEHNVYIMVRDSLLEESFPFDIFEETDHNKIEKLMYAKHINIKEMKRKFDEQQKYKTNGKKSYYYGHNITQCDIEKAEKEKLEVDNMQQYTLHEMFNGELGKFLVETYVNAVACKELFRHAEHEDLQYKAIGHTMKTDSQILFRLKHIFNVANELITSIEIKKKFISYALNTNIHDYLERFASSSNEYDIKNKWCKEENDILTKKDKENNEIPDYDEWVPHISTHEYSYLKLQKRYDQFTQFIKQSLTHFPNEIVTTCKQIHTELNQKYNTNPIDLHVTTNTITYSVDCEGCPLCDIDCFSDAELNAFFYNPHFRTKFNDFEMLLENVKNDEHNTFTGTIKIISPIKTFNHASCQCDTRTFKSKSQTYNTTIKFETDVEFELYENKIIVKLDPNIVM